MYQALMRRHEIKTGWQKIPWHEPEFSRRMLREHLSQEHDLASRRLSFIERAVSWIHEGILQGIPSRILDLGCGPGFYMHRFAELGHTCTGIDFGPASIEYARVHHRGEYILGDVMTTAFGDGFDLICMIYGEFNAFSPQQAQSIVDKAHCALKPSGKLLLEVSHRDAILRLAQSPPTWSTHESGLFSDQPHIVLEESGFEDGHACSWYYVIDAGSGALSQYVAMHQAYSSEEYRGLLNGYSSIATYPALTGKPESDDAFFVILADA